MIVISECILFSLALFVIIVYCCHILLVKNG